MELFIHQFIYLLYTLYILWLLRQCSGKESACQCRRGKRHGFNPWVGKIPQSKKQQPIPVFLPGKFHGQRSLGSMGSMGSQRVRHDSTHKHTYIPCNYLYSNFSSVQFSSVAQSCPTLCDPMNHSTPGLPVHHQLPESTQTHVH